ncbi:peptide-N(4)-(N-acetyl-beta-glucosaminyl)asparagine amidase [Copidosoma floridanum]|uniref:peptide-N(4)-(N-acetyl-beta- glucosaminyl)asparagine amidase n=1 Tax=Copidosoma floridanum TaxID=29053 RepID=UPI0006C94AEA|nr:peptide-N(4)-(N-acetyl-beta-glucosaminyl)asparagine amidase [Copidosoma floridanum]
MPGNLQYSISLLKDNEESVRQDAQRVLLKICDNILKFPKEIKYRKINLSDTIFSTQLLPAAGAVECLFEAGFEENDDEFILPLDASLSSVEKLYSLLNNQLKPASTPSAPKSDLNSKQPLSLLNIGLVEEEYKKKNFFQQIQEMFKSVLRYENESLQSKVKSILPLPAIEIAAMEKLREIQKEVKTKKVPDNNVVYEDALLAELLSWFKNKFFKWVNSPACENCMGECSYEKSLSSTNPNISRIEIHKCKSCGSKNEFPRYTDPECLLYSRRGRCGEWANCFTLICRTVGFDARLVVDKTDHVWTEVWSPAHNRWIHADACENTMDRPLLYETGWGKKLSYVIAYSKDEVQDVTWRYTRNFHDVMKRRKIMSEAALSSFTAQLNHQRQNSNVYSSARKKFVNKRSALELAEMLTAPPGCKKPSELENDTEYGGRTSGSLTWRLGRGETGNRNVEPAQWTIPQGVKSYELVYSIVSDTYVARDSGNNKVLTEKQKWQDGIATTDGGVFRKEEQDWNMVYLARSPGSAAGEVTWTLVVEDTANVHVDSVKLQAVTATFNGAALRWKITGIIGSNVGESKVVVVDSSENFETQDLKGAIKLSVSVTMSGGEGDVAWQHAQLFRQSLKTSSMLPSLVIKVNLTNT